MFQTLNAESVSFPSTWKKSTSKDEVQTQTDTYKIVHRGINVKKTREKDSQTEDFMYVEEDIHADTDESELIDFIKLVTPSIIEVLKENEVSDLFKLPKFIDSSNSTNKCIYSISLSNNLPSDARNIIGLSWSPIGTVLAVGYGEMSHTEWCNHTHTGIGIYSLSSLDKNQSINSNEPELFLETNSCLGSLMFHTTLPSLIAAGTQNGEILIWDRTQTDNQLLIASNEENHIHEESIVTIKWFQSQKSKSQMSYSKFLTMSCDGTLVLWSLHLRKYKLAPLNCWKLAARDLPKSMRHGGGKSSKSMRSVCTMCADINPSDNEQVAVGSDVGVVFLCRISGTFSNKDEPIDIEKEFKSPLDTILTSSIGSVHSIKWSKVVPNQITVASADGVIYVYNSEAGQLIVSVDTSQGYLYDIDESCMLYGLLASVGTKSSCVVLTDLAVHCGLKQLQQNEPGITLIANGGAEDDKKTCDTAITVSVAFNDILWTYVAFGDNNGSVFIWQLNDKQILENCRDNNKLNELQRLFECNNVDDDAVGQDDCAISITNK